MFAKDKISQSMIDAVNKVLGEKTENAVVKDVLLDESSVKIPTATGTRVYGSSYGNSAKAVKDQTKSSVDDIKEPSKKQIEKDVKEELKGDQHKIDANKNDKIDGQDFEILRKKKVKEDMYFANKLLETVRKSDVPAYLRKAKGDTPLTVADVKGPKKDSISAPENLAKNRNEEVEHLDEDNLDSIAKKHGMEFKRTTYGAGMKHPTHGEVSINRYGEWNHKGKTGDSTDKFASLDKHLSSLKEGLEDLSEEQLDEMINEVLGKDATAGDWISDFVHSDNPKFAGKSKAERKKMALGAYYGKQNETYQAAETEVTTDTLAGRMPGGKANSFKSYKLRVRPFDKEGEQMTKSPEVKQPVQTAARQSHEVHEATIAGTSGWEPIKGTDKEGNVKDKSGAVHTPMSRARDLARQAFNKIKKEVK